MFDLYTILQNLMTPVLAAVLLIIVALAVMAFTGKWEKYFFTYKDFVCASFFVLAGVVCFLGMPELRYRKLYRNLIAVVVTIFLIVKIYGKDHFIFPKNLMLKKWDKISKRKGKLCYKIAYRLLSSYEKMWVELEEIKDIYEEQPYEAYCRLKKLDVSHCNEEMEDTYNQLLAASLYGMGAYSEAKGLLEKMLQKHPDNPGTLVMLCVVYDRTGKNCEAMQIAEDTYQKMISGRLKVDLNLSAQIYHNYACFLICGHHINKGLDVAREAADYALQQKNLRVIHFVVRDYLKLLIQYSKDDSKIPQYWEKYQEAVGESCDTCIPYINTKLYLLQMNYPIGDIGQYLTDVYNLNKEHLSGEGKCFLCQTCMNVAFSHSRNIDFFLKEIVELMKSESRYLELMKRLRFYNGLTTVAENYSVQCNRNAFPKSEYYDEFLELYLSYTNTEKENEIKKMLDATESIWIHQKCELREMLIDIQRKKEYNFDNIYEQLLQIYKECELGQDVRAMLDIDMNIIEECERIENLENVNLPPQYMRSGKRDVLLRHLQDAQRLLDLMNYDAARVEYAIRMSKGYVFAGKMKEAKEQLKIFEDAKIPETFLLEWERDNCMMLQSILQEETAR